MFVIRDKKTRLLKMEEATGMLCIFDTFKDADRYYKATCKEHQELSEIQEASITLKAVE